MSHLRLIAAPRHSEEAIYTGGNVLHIPGCILTRLYTPSMPAELCPSDFARTAIASIDKVPDSAMRAWPHGQGATVSPDKLDLDEFAKVQERAGSLSLSPRNIAVSSMAYHLWQRTRISERMTDNVIQFRPKRS